MDVGIIKDNICIDAAVFEDMTTAQRFFEQGVWPGAENISALPDGFGIGDSYLNGKWVKAEQPEPPEPPEPVPDISELTEALRILTGGADDELDQIISDNP